MPVNPFIYNYPAPKLLPGVLEFEFDGENKGRRLLSGLPVLCDEIARLTANRDDDPLVVLYWNPLDLERYIPEKDPCVLPTQ